MKTTEKTTIYLNPSVRKALKRRALETDETISKYVERAVTEAIAEDLQDIEAAEVRRGGATESLDDFLTALKKDGVL